jgi:[amino group carrier protein]-L-2-aminoadipate 6-kinase
VRLVVGCGGSPGLARSAVLADVAALRGIGERIVLVHGGGEEARPAIVTELQQLGSRAVGLSGVDGGLVRARRRPPLALVAEGRAAEARHDTEARIVDVRPALLELLLEGGFLPALSPPALDPAVGPVDVDADLLASAVAGAVRADRLVLLSEAPGLLRDPADPASVVRRIDGDLDEHAWLADSDMATKLLAAREALEAGVPQVHVAGEGAAPVRRALVGSGTTISASPETARAAG